MTREQLEHLIRAAGSIVGSDEVLVIGSQAILGSFPESRLPSVVTLSMEADLTFLDDPSDVLSDLVDGSIGEESPFQHRFGVYAQGVSVSTAVLPQGWRDRLVPVQGPGTRGITGLCLEVHDLWVSKVAAGRSSDIVYCEALLADGLVDVDVLHERLAITDLAPAVAGLANAVIDRVDPRRR